MASGVPLPNSEQVFSEINALVLRTTRYLAANDWDVRRLSRLAEQLISADAAEGHRALANVLQLTGDRESALHHIENAVQVGHNKPSYAISKVIILCNLGYFSEALATFQKYAAPEKGNMTNAWKWGYFCGGFRTMASFLPKAKKMQLDLEGLDIDTAERAANVTENAGVSDEDVAKVLDAAGAVLRKHGFFFVGDGLRVKVFDGHGQDAFVEFGFDVDVSVKEAHDLYREFVDQVIENGPAAPSVVSVSFRPWKQRNERNAA